MKRHHIRQAQLRAFAGVSSAALLISAAAMLAGCTPAQIQQAQAIQNDGRLFCARATAAGPIVASLANAAGVPVRVTDESSAAVAKACALWDAVPVMPPATVVPVVAVPTTLQPVIDPRGLALPGKVS